MSHPFPNTFDNASPMTPQSAVSYQANVNRQKTRKWAEAKPVDYGGDDWGDEDDYDLPPVPAPKATGMRKRGQSLVGSSQVDSAAESRKYGDLPPLTGASNPRARANSFDADDETRNFSSSTAQPPPAMDAPATRFSQITGQPTVRNASGPPDLSIRTQQPSQGPGGLRKPNQVLSPMTESSLAQADARLSRPEGPDTGGSSSASDTKSPSTATDSHAPPDYSPSDVPPPLNTRSSPAPQSSADTQTQKFPPRRSSLSQPNAPALGDILQQNSGDATPKPWAGPRSASPGTSAQPQVSPTTGKPHPFIRPSEIYKRAEEEQRASIDSAHRPSTGSSVKSEVLAKPGSDGLSGAAQSRNSFENDESGDSGSRLMPMLESVKERKSEYDFESSNPLKEGKPSLEETAFQTRNPDVEDGRLNSTSPKLPDLNRLSGFGMDLFAPQDMEAVKQESENTPAANTHLSSPVEELQLRSQPSLGFNSVVHQAFDRTDDQSHPSTPASRSDSGVRRTDSESTGTTGISPIMSRVSSHAVPETRNRTSAILEAPEPASPDTPVDSRDGLPSQSVPGFKPGHRRDISTPSPRNSPARTPDLVPSYTLAHGQRAVVDDIPHDLPSPIDNDEPFQAPRPINERESSFRPSIPGGWTSYATTAQNETHTPSAVPAPTVQTPAVEAPLGYEQRDEGKRGLTPITNASPAQNSPAEEPKTLSGVPAMSSGGSRHPSPDPRQREEAPTEFQPRPDVTDRPVPAMSMLPLLPPKISTNTESHSDSPGYIPQAPATEDTTHTSPVSTNSQNYDEENEKLRKEIVRSLSPRPSDATAQNDSHLSSTPDNRASIANRTRESSYLPQEYDSYWDSEQDEDDPTIPQASTQINASTDEPVPVIAPLSSRHQQEGSLYPPRPTPDSCFSWEQSFKNVAAGVNRDTGSLSTVNAPTKSVEISELPGSEVPAEGDKKSMPPEHISSQDLSGEHHLVRDAATVTGGAALAGAAPVTGVDKTEDKPRRMSIAEEKDPRISSNPVSPTPSEDEHPSRSSQQNIQNSSDIALHPPGSPSTVSRSQKSATSAPAPTGRLIAFREIIAMKTPQERIKTFNETRERFASMDSGLNDWMSQLQSEIPAELGSVSGSWGAGRSSMPSGSARSKFSRVTGGAPLPLQQPYYQQYLNATPSPAPSTPVSGGGPGGSSGPKTSPGLPVGSPQGFSSSGTKLSTQQVQARGKEFLHTAGVFGGKAGKVGKGLLAKGKNKLAARGGDKTPSSPENQERKQKEREKERENPKSPKANRRRSSWGIPLVMGSSRHSRDGRSQSSIPDSLQSPPPSSAPRLPVVETGSSLEVSNVGAGRERNSGVAGTLNYGDRDGDGNREILDFSSAREITGLSSTLAPFNRDGGGNQTGLEHSHEDARWRGSREKPELATLPGNERGLLASSEGGGDSDSEIEDLLFFDAMEENGDGDEDEVEVGGAGVDWALVNPEPLKTSAAGVDLGILNNRPRGNLGYLSHDRARPSTPANPVSQLGGREEMRRSIDGGSTTSILNRPRGSLTVNLSDDVPGLSAPGKVMPSPLANSPVAIVYSPTTATPISNLPPVPTRKNGLPLATNQEERSSTSAFLPPIRRTSTFASTPRSGQPNQHISETGVGDDEEQLSTREDGKQQEMNMQQREGAGMDHPAADPGTEAVASGLRQRGEEGVEDAPDGPDGPGDAARWDRSETAVAMQNETQGPDHATGERPLSFELGSSFQKQLSSPVEEEFRLEYGTDTWGVQEDYAPLIPRIRAERQSSQSSFPPPGFVIDDSALAAPAGDRQDQGPADGMDTWGVREELAPVVLGVPVPSISFPPPGFEVDAQAHSSARVVQETGFVDPISRQPLSFVQTPPQKVVGHLSQPASATANTVRNRSPRQLPPIDTGAAVGPLPLRPFSFQQTPPRGLDTVRRRPSFAADLTKEPEALDGADETNHWDKRDPAPSEMRTPSPKRFDSHRQLASDPEKEELAHFQAGAEKPSSNQARVLKQSQPARQREPPRSGFTPPRAADILQRPEFKESHVEWRPNRPKVAVRPQPSYSSEMYSKEMDLPANRANSWDTEPRSRGFSGSSNMIQRQDSNFSENGGYTSPPQEIPSYLPPSSASRYPELFRTGQQTVVENRRTASQELDRDRDLPDHLYQAPIPRAQAFLPRQQTSEYQLRGIGPPPDLYPVRRSSGLFRGRLSRTSSRNRRNSTSRSPDRILDSRAASSILNPEDVEIKKKRASIFSHLSKNSLVGNSAHHAWSRPNLLETPQLSPVKRRFFGSERKEEKPKRLVRQSTTGAMDWPKMAKEKTAKNRFSALGGLFGRQSPGKGNVNAVQDRPLATRELSHGDRQPIENLMPEPQIQGAYTPPPPQEPNSRAGSQSRRSGGWGTIGGGMMLERPREVSKTPRSSSRGLLGGFWGKKDEKRGKGNEDSRIQGSGRSQAVLSTYSPEQEIRGPPSAQQRESPFQDPALEVQDRGRRVSREPQYDSVPIPRGYSLVRGQGAVSIPTEYDPRGLNRMQQQQHQIDTRGPTAGSRLPYENNVSPIHDPQQHWYLFNSNVQQYGNDSPYNVSQQQPRMGALETHMGYINSNRRPSREDLLARSPARHPDDQQRPYQISLPNSDPDEEELTLHYTPPSISPQQSLKLKLDTVQRLQQPSLRHPESPAGYPLPDDTVFSPVNPSAENFPAPPMPQWPSHLESQYALRHGQGHERQPSLPVSAVDVELDHSNTRRTALPAISTSRTSTGIGPSDRGLHVAGESVRGMTPTPPNPLHGLGNGIGDGEIKRTEVEVRGRRKSVVDDDLYDASPILPDAVAMMSPHRANANGNGNGNGNGSAHRYPYPYPYPSPYFSTPTPASAQAQGTENAHAQRLTTPPDSGLGHGFGAAIAAADEKMEHRAAADVGGKRGEGFLHPAPEWGPAELADFHEPAMSATSYPGQEWNPYGVGLGVGAGMGDERFD
ncbi:hypothetical protein LZ554_005767 [Drepanopeziza brunnea f. sp. 'monogermtubi']|nr:hypothetical protein LZ554_005767 [Drepanopeziza brunnea f. sp. 'monogermtubi']